MARPGSSPSVLRRYSSGALRRARRLALRFGTVDDGDGDLVLEGLLGDPTEDALRTLLYWPGSGENPYFELLYRDLPAQGRRPVPIGGPEIFEDLRSMGGPGEVPDLHVHWSQYLSAYAHRDPWPWARRGLQRIDELLAAGGRLALSIHEPYAHDFVDYQLECWLKAELVQRATVVHLLSAATLEEVRRHYDLPEHKLLISTHPLFTGAYRDVHTRASARALLGIAEEERLVLFLGAIKPYKGLRRLLDAHEALRASGAEDVRLLVAGRPYPQLPGVAADLARADAAPGVDTIPKMVPDADVAALFRAADAVALPYDRIHNSGVLMLALTFGIPVIAPDEPVVVEAVPSGLVATYDRDDPDAGLAAALETWWRTGSPTPGTMPAAYESTVDPEVLGPAFARDLCAALDAVPADEPVGATRP